MNADYFRSMFDYHFWAHRRVWDCVMQLNESQYRQPCDYSVGSVHEQVTHTYGAERLWLGRVRQEPKPVFPPASDFADRAAVRAAWDVLEQEWRAFLETLDDTHLMQTITYTSVTYHRHFTNPLWQAFTQVLNHGTDHRAQTLALIHQLGGETAAQDFIFYTWEK